MQQHIGGWVTSVTQNQINQAINCSSRLTNKDTADEERARTDTATWTTRQQSVSALRVFLFCLNLKLDLDTASYEVGPWVGGIASKHGSRQPCASLNPKP